MVQSVNFVDGFPIGPEDPNFEIHQKIDSDMRNASALRNTAAPPAMLFPEYMAARTQDQDAWLAPLLERYAWNHDRGADANEVLNPLAGILRMVLWEQQVDDATLLLMMKYGPSLRSDDSDWDCYRLQDVVLLNVHRRKERLSEEMGRALGGLVHRLELKPDHGNACFLLAFRLFLDGYCRIPWAEHIDEEFPNGEGWRPLLNLVALGKLARGPHMEQLGPKAKVIRKAGLERVVQLVTRAATSMEASQPVEISAAGCLLFEQMLFWAAHCPDLEMDEAIYKICGVLWAPVTTEAVLFRNFIRALLAAVSKRSGTRAFACAERLSNHPQLKVFVEVQRLYEQLLTENVGARPAGTTGIDGFALKNEMDFVVEQALKSKANRTDWRQSRYLGIIDSKSHLEIVLRQMKHDWPAALKALNARVEWLAQQAPTIEGEHLEMPWLSWSCDLGELYLRILAKNPRLNWEDLVGLCKADSTKWLGVRPSELALQHCSKWIASNGYRKELSVAMHPWRKSVYGPGIGSQQLRRKIDWLLWFDTEAPIEDKSCWSAAIQLDLREMPQAKSKAWISLVQNISFGAVEKPTRQWLNLARKALDAVGREAFQKQMLKWFEPLRNGERLRLSVAGRDLMASLFWYSLLAEDAEIDEAVLCFAKANWKTKADRGRTAKLLPIWIYTISQRSPERAIEAIHAYRDLGGLNLTGKSLRTYESLCKRFEVESQISPPPPPPAFDKEAFLKDGLKRMLKNVLGPEANVYDDAVEIGNPSGERYRIAMNDGRIVRLSDGKVVRLEIDWNSMPFVMQKQLVDSRDLMNPFAPNPFRIAICAQILTGWLEVEVPIVVDEE